MQWWMNERLEEIIYVYHSFGRGENFILGFPKCPTQFASESPGAPHILNLNMLEKNRN